MQILWKKMSVENTFSLLCCASFKYLPDRLCHALTIGGTSSHAVHRMRDATSSPRGDFPQYLAWHVGKKNFPATPTSFHAFVSFGNSDLWVPAEHLCSALSHHTPQSFCTYTSTPLLLYDLLTSDDEEYFCKTILINDLRIFYASRAFGIVAYRIGSIPNLKANSGLRIPQHLWSMDCMDGPVGLGRTRPSTAPIPCRCRCPPLHGAVYKRRAQ